MNRNELIVLKNPKSPISEIFRTLRTNIQFMTTNKKLKTLLVTSSMPGEGKSWVSANLILAFAQEGKKVIIVDSDMRKGRIHQIFNIDRKPGLSNYLSGIIEKEDKDNIFNYIKQTEIENLYIMPGGDIPPNPSELLVSERTSILLESLKSVFDIIIFDGTPSSIVTDALILARQVDATLIVTAHKTTKIGDVEKIKKSIENVGGKIAGIVINKIPISAKKYENSYYYGHKEISNEYKEIQTENENIDNIKQIYEFKDEKENIEKTKMNEINRDEIEKTKEELNELTRKINKELEEEMMKIKNTQGNNEFKGE